MNQLPPVAVTGAGCVTAAGRDLPRTMAAVMEGRRSPAPPVRFTTGHLVRHPVFEILPPVLPEDEARERGILLTSALGLVAAREAIAAAGLDAASLAGLRVGVVCGTTVGSAMNSEEFYRDYRAGGHPDMAPIERFLRSNPAAVVAREFGLTGPCETVVNACSSGSDAVGLAADWIRTGLADVVLAGGADELCRVTVNGFISLMITDDAPCAPFDRNRKGLNLGEGAAFLVMESEELASRRGVRPMGLLLGYGSSCDAHHLTAPHPEGAGLSRAVARALAEAGVRGTDLAFVNAHGTATPDNDKVEGRFLARVLPGVPFLSTKGYTGHTLGAAGAIEAAITLACLAAGLVPGNAGFSEPDPELSGAVPVATVTPISGRYALSQSLAFGGSNAALVFGRV
jgi:3-oxoacyl-[acyl-carrier-protein] synthase-1/3-oxoacyl-[acyl-carrier-protein] synthase II